MEKIFRPSQTRSTLIWGLILLAIIDTPLLLILFLGFQASPLFLVTFSVVLILIDIFVLSLGFMGKRMSYKLGENEFTVVFGFSKRRIPYADIRKVQLFQTKLLFRLFGASWPGLHWGLYKAKEVGKIWVCSTKMRGDFVLIELVNDKKIAISPANPEDFLNEISTRKGRFGTSSPTEVKTFETTKRILYLQIMIVAIAFFVFLGYLLWIYPSLPEIIPMHFDLNLNPDRWAHKSELFIIAGIAAIFPTINTILTLKFGKYGRELAIFLGVVFVSVMALFFGIVYFIQTII